MKTPRQWLIEWSVQELKRAIRDGRAPADRKQAARLAMEIVCDAKRRPGTLGAAIIEYYTGATETARERLDTTIARLAA